VERGRDVATRDEVHGCGRRCVCVYVPARTHARMHARMYACPQVAYMWVGKLESVHAIMCACLHACVHLCAQRWKALAKRLEPAVVKKPFRTLNPAELFTFKVHVENAQTAPKTINLWS